MCDYCNELSVCKITIHNHYWELCLDCAKKNKDRLMIKQKDLDILERELSSIKEVSLNSSHQLKSGISKW